VLRFEDRGQAVEIELSPRAVIALRTAIARARLDGTTASLFEALTVHLECAINSAVRKDVRPPTYAQVTYAIAIARDLEISIPGDALRYRREMQKFLARVVPLHQVAGSSHTEESS
jgi:hypothetical protein